MKFVPSDKSMLFDGIYSGHPKLLQVDASGRVKIVSVTPGNETYNDTNTPYDSPISSYN